MKAVGELKLLKTSTDDEKAVGNPHEEELVSLLLRGNGMAAERLVEMSYGRIYGALFKMCKGDEQLARDLTQDTYRKAWKALPGFDGRSKFSSWLYRIAYNTYLNHARRPRIIGSLDEDDNAGGMRTEESQEKSVIDAEHSLLLRNAVGKLPEKLRFALTAKYWAELPVREIARLEKISSVAVRKRIKKALGILEKKIDPQ